MEGIRYFLSVACWTIGSRSFVVKVNEKFSLSHITHIRLHLIFSGHKCFSHFNHEGRWCYVRILSLGLDVIVSAIVVLS